LFYQQDFAYQIVSAQDLHNYTQMVTSNITQKLVVPFHRPFEILQRCLSAMFDLVEHIRRDDKPALLIHASSDSFVGNDNTSSQVVKPENTEGGEDTLPTEEEIERAEQEEERQQREHELLKQSTVAIVSLQGGGESKNLQSVQLQWVANPVTDMLADALVAALLQLETNPTGNQKDSTTQILLYPYTRSFFHPFLVAEAAAARTHLQSTTERLDVFKQLLVAHFGESKVETNEKEEKVIVILEDGSKATCDPVSGYVFCESSSTPLVVKEAIVAVCKRATELLPPLKSQHHHQRSNSHNNQSSEN
jgi:hypothetical protein